MHTKGASISAREHRVTTSPSAKEHATGGPLTAKELELMNAYWRAGNYLSVGVIYLQDNPLLRRAPKGEGFKNPPPGHRGARPAPSFLWAHPNRGKGKNDPDG